MATKPFLSQIAVPVGTTTGDVYYPQTSLLMHFNGTNGSTTMTDNSKNVLVATAVGNAKLSTAQSKFGGSSLLLDGTGDYLTFPANSEFAFGTGNFTIECWIYFAAGSTYRGIFSTRATSSTSVTTNGSFGVNAENGIFLWTNTFIINYTTNIGTNQWVHVALCRNGSSLKAFANGTEVGSTTYTDNLTGNLATIGANGDGSEAFNGYIDELRITKGIARYTGNFTPSTTQFLDSTGDANSSVVVNSTATGFAIGTGGINGAQLAKAWVNFNGTGTVAITDSYNVSSITDLGTGQYLVNFSTARSNANYVHFISIPGNSDSPGNSFTTNTGNNSYSQTTTYAVVTTRFNGSLYDTGGIHSIVFSN
jgi:hypothetical protein